MMDAHPIAVLFILLSLASVCGVGYTIWTLRREARGLEKFARTFREMKDDAEASGGDMKTEATAFKDVFKP